MATKQSISQMYFQTGIIRGNIIDSFILTPAKFVVEGKGDLAALEPLFWDKVFIDLNAKSKLYIIISKNLKGNHVQLSFKLASFFQNPPRENGTINVVFEFGKSANPIVTKFQVPYSSGLASYSVRSLKEYVDDSAIIELTCPGYSDVAIQEVKVEIFEPLPFSRIFQK